MTFSGDPYRTLGLVPGASLDDVKRAYRRLAKQYHPDAAGPDAVARFLAIQGAYEALAAPGRRGRIPGRGPGRPSQADPDRARSTREAYRAERGGGWGRHSEAGPGRTDDPWRGGTRSTAGAAPTGDAGSSARSRSGPGASRARTPGSSATGPEAPGGSGRAEGGTSPEGTQPGGTSPGGTSRARRPEGARRGGSDEGAAAGTAQSRRRTSGDRGPDRKPNRRKATLTSTSYDDAAQEPRHPEWQGSSWYGTSSGTYWTINPREYADPRKHGPDYQARARRASGPDQPRTPDRAEATTSTSASFAARGASEAWSDAGSHAETRPRASAAGGPPGAGSETPGAASRVASAGSIGLLAGTLAAIPASVVALGSMMNGDLSLAALAVAAPVIVAAAVGLTLGITRRARS